MTATDTAPAPTRAARARHYLGRVAGATLARARRPRHGSAQALGVLVALGGIYHGWGWTATLIIGGVVLTVASMLREGDRI